MINIVKMAENHISDVVDIENKCFKIPWTKSSFEKEIKNNKLAVYFVALDNEKNRVVGYGGMWHVINEGHITNIAVKEEYRKRGIATKIIEKLSEFAMEKEMIGLTLEVRAKNYAAIKLYKKLGFYMEGIRPEYYSDTKEDAIIMWKYFIPKEMIIEH